jgi:predicted ferric reductase
MSNLKPSTREAAHSHLETWALGGVLILTAGLLGAFGYIIIRFLPISQSVASLFSWLFANNSVHTTWYITRAAGWVAYFLLWFSMVWGLVIPTKFLEKFISPTFAVDFHEYLSLLSLSFIVLHVTVLLFDQYLPFRLSQILVPFMSTYRPLWVGLGVIGAYLSILVTVTFYLRKKIGQKRFKSIHTFSILAYLGVILHAFFAGSDSSLAIVQWIYLSTFLVVVFLTAYWLILGRQLQKGKSERPALPNAARAIRR